MAQKVPSAKTLIRLPNGRHFSAVAAAFPRSYSLTRGLRLACRMEAGRAGYAWRHKVGGVELVCGQLPDLLRGLGTLLAYPGRRAMAEAPAFEQRALMLDASRNGVPTLDYLLGLLPRLAVLGYNGLSLYTEDTLEIPGHPLVGHRRGRYSAAELTRLAGKARQLGIELFPSLQTLGHMEQLLRLPAYAPARDNEAVLRPDSPLARRLIDGLLRAAKAAYGCSRINVGLDEAWGLGRGESFVRGRRIDPREVFLRHANWVAGRCQSLGLKPVIWADMLSGSSGEEPLAPAQVRRLSRRLALDYWDYYREEQSEYSTRIRAFQRLGFKLIVSPGLQNWNRMFAHWAKAWKAMPPMMAAAQGAGVREAMLTSWGNDGQEAPLASALPGQCLFAELAYAGRASRASVGAMLQAVGGEALDAYEAGASMECFDERSRYVRTNLSKCLLWDDPLLRIYASHSPRRWEGKFRRASLRLRRGLRKARPANRPLLRYALALAQVLAIKADLGNLAAAAYRRRDRAALRALDSRFAAAAAALRRLWAAQRRTWTAEFKAFGFEVLDLRYGGLLGRLAAARAKVRAALRGARIEEYDEPDRRVFPGHPYIQPFYRQFNTLTVQK